MNHLYNRTGYPVYNKNIVRASGFYTKRVKIK